MSMSVVSLASTASTKILSEESIQILRLRNDHSPVNHGFRSVSNTSYMSESSLDSQETVQIPEYLESQETFRFLEFNENTAKALWDLYCEIFRDEPERCDILEMAKYHVTSTPGDAGQGDDWVAHMDRVGLTKNFQARLMAPEAQEMRQVASANEWAILMITMRFEFLECIDDIIKTPSRGVELPADRITPNGELYRISAAGVEIPERGSGKGKLPPKGNFKAGPSTAVKPPPPAEMEGYQMFYKGGGLGRLEAVFEAGVSLNFDNLRTPAPTDFSFSTSGLYLTKQVEVAWKYAQWAARVVDGNIVPIGILQVAIPTPLLASSYQLIGSDWRTYVWNSRHIKSPPQNLAFIREFQWIVGPTCMQSPHIIKKMKDPSELEAWCFGNGQVAHQLFTCNEQMFSLLSQHCLGKVWVTSIASKSSK